MSRFDIPDSSTPFRPNEPLTLGGVAFAGDRGISRVEVSTDDGKTWNQARIAPALSPLSWVLWIYTWTPTRNGDYSALVRATDLKGDLQTDVRTESLPDGATGYDNLQIVIAP
jgi:hypothetical protein